MNVAGRVPSADAVRHTDGMLLTRRAVLAAAAAALGAAVAGTLTTGCSDRGAAEGPGALDVDAVMPRLDLEPVVMPWTSVVMIGDSITLGSKARLTERFDALGFSSVTIDAEQGRRIRVGNGRTPGEVLNGIDVAHRLIAADTPDEVWVVALGTNDIGQLGDDADAYRGLIDEMIAVVPEDRPLVWVDCLREQFPQANEIFDRELVELSRRRPATVVGEWAARAQPRIGEVLRTDRLHPNEVGEALFADVVVEALRHLAAVWSG